MVELEKLILDNLIHNIEYTRKVLPFLKKEYFRQESTKLLFELINNFFETYNNCPTEDSLKIEIDSSVGLSPRIYDEAKLFVNEFKNEKQDESWLLDQTEKFCQERAVQNGILESMTILEGNSKFTKEAIPSILQSALSVSFEHHIGHNYIEDSEQRFSYYHKKEEKIPFDIDVLNDVTGGGVEKKTLNILIAGTHVGKSLGLCHLAASYLMRGLNVVYITMEMAEEKIAERIDANLLDVQINALRDLPQDIFAKKIERIRSKTLGKLFIKEYPTASVHVGHFRHLLNELRLKKNFQVDVVVIDYINICASSRLKYNNGINSYMMVKSIAEELRGLGVEFNVPIWTATQTNRQGYCLDKNTFVIEKNKGNILLKDVKINDELLSSNGYNTVVKIFDKSIKKSYKIKTKSGKEIICSAEHIFPTKFGELSISAGLKIGNSLYINNMDCNTNKGNEREIDKDIPN